MTRVLAFHLMKLTNLWILELEKASYPQGGLKSQSYPRTQDRLDSGCPQGFKSLKWLKKKGKMHLCTAWPRPYLLLLT
jgi:hypothetical protein